MPSFNTQKGHQATELFKKEEDVFLTREDFIRSVNDLTPTMNSIGQEAIVYQYTDWRNPHDSTVNRDAIDKIVGDYHFTCHVSALADKYASMSGEEVFMYYFTHRSSRSPWMGNAILSCIKKEYMKESRNYQRSVARYQLVSCL